MPREVVITGIGMVTPLGHDPATVLRRIQAGEIAAAPPTRFDPAPFACRLAAEIDDINFQPQAYLPEPKMSRLMNRDSLLAVAAARLALRDSGVKVGADYAPEEVGLFGATGLAGLPLREVLPLIKASTAPDGRFDPARFGEAGLRSISPLMSFKILSNMPVCFVSICENIQGPNAIYTPWEGQGAQAIEAGLRAIAWGDAQCALVGGCDVKTHELAFLTLEQHGLFDSWRTTQRGTVPGEGACFLVLEPAERAQARGRMPYAKVAGYKFSSRRPGPNQEPPLRALLSPLANAWKGRAALSSARRSSLSQPNPPPPVQTDIGGSVLEPSFLLAAADGDPHRERDESEALAAAGVNPTAVIAPKRHLGNLFAAAAAVQVGLGALLGQSLGGAVLVNCFDHGSTQAAWRLEPA